MSPLKLGYETTVTSVWLAPLDFLLHLKAGNTSPSHNKTALAFVGFRIAKARWSLCYTGHVWMQKECRGHSQPFREITVFIPRLTSILLSQEGLLALCPSRIILRAAAPYPWRFTVDSSDNHLQYACYIFNTVQWAELQEGKSRVTFLTVPGCGIRTQTHCLTIVCPWILNTVIFQHLFHPFW